MHSPAGYVGYLHNLLLSLCFHTQNLRRSKVYNMKLFF